MIFRDVVYFELKKLRSLIAKKPHNVSDYLPDNVKYNSLTNELAHTYRGGKVVATNLTELNIQRADLFDKLNLRDS